MGAKGSQETVGRKQHAERSRVNHGRVKVKNSRRRVDRSTDVHSQAAVESNRVGTPRLAKKVGAPPHNTSEDLTLREESKGERGRRGARRRARERRDTFGLETQGPWMVSEGAVEGAPPFSD